MDTELISRVLNHARKGSNILFGRSHTGSLKIKVQHGPFNMLTSRYRTNSTTFEELRRLLATAR